MSASAAHATAPTGTRLPVAIGAVEWVERATRIVSRGAVLLVDYFATTDELVARGPDWLRTYAGHRRGHDPFAIRPGESDITADVPLEPILAVADAELPPTITTQADWLVDIGLDADVADARAAIDDGLAAGGDPRALAALAHRSTINEAAALTDPSGLGAHRVVRMPRSRR
jgi:SAM-dependent MidA family methyltransferase